MTIGNKDFWQVDLHEEQADEKLYLGVANAFFMIYWVSQNKRPAFERLLLPEMQ